MFSQLYKKHPDFIYTLFVRSPERAKLVQEQYSGSNIHFVYGNLDSSDVIEKAAAEADIVLRKPSPHVAGIRVLERKLTGRLR